ncbi:hypothetical protein DFH09DRAFT_1337026 [Mycena vulgaris]|nr:hypothetical protein DFH09DRAFT_1337026 [Mycena vulgaris]
MSALIPSLDSLQVPCASLLLSRPASPHLYVWKTILISLIYTHPNLDCPRETPLEVIWWLNLFCSELCSSAVLALPYFSRDFSSAGRSQLRLPSALIRPDLLPVLRVLPEQVWDAPAPRGAASPMPFWRKAYVILTVVRALALVGAVATSILLVPRTVPIPAEVRTPEPPPPDPWRTCATGSGTRFSGTPPRPTLTKLYALRSGGVDLAATNLALSVVSCMVLQLRTSFNAYLALRQPSGFRRLLQVIYAARHRRSTVSNAGVALVLFRVQIPALLVMTLHCPGPASSRDVFDLTASRHPLPSFLAGLLQRRPQPAPPPILSLALIRQDLFLVLPVLPQQIWDEPAPRAPCANG